MDKLLNTLRQQPIIASIKSEKALEHSLNSHAKVLTILYGNITNISEIVNKAKMAEKTVLVNVDMISGYAPAAASIKDLQQRVGVDGILSSKALLVKTARQLKMPAIHRLFMIDSFAYHQIPKQIKSSSPSALEILPGSAPRVLKWIKEDTNINLPLIAGGLVCELDDVKAALLSGATAVATSEQSLWNLRGSR